MGESAILMGGGPPEGIRWHLNRKKTPVVVWDFWLMRNDIRLLRMIWEHLETGVHRYIITPRDIPDLHSIPSHRRGLFERILSRFAVVELSDDPMETLRYVLWLAAEHGIISAMVPGVGLDEANAILREFLSQCPWLRQPVSLFDLKHIAHDYHHNRKTYFECYRPMLRGQEPSLRFENLPPCPEVKMVAPPHERYEWWADKPHDADQLIPPLVYRIKNQTNYWGKAPWNAFIAMASERFQEVDVYHAGHARTVIERAEQDGCRLGFSGSDSVTSVEFSGLGGGHWFQLDVSVADKTIFIRTLTGSRFREKIRRVQEHARRWLYGLYPGEDGEIQPRSTDTMDLIIDRSLHWEADPVGREAVRHMLMQEGVVDPTHKRGA